MVFRGVSFIGVGSVPKKLETSGKIWKLGKKWKFGKTLEIWEKNLEIWWETFEI